MNYLLKRLNELNPKTSDEAVFIVREFLQEIVLIGLSRGGFFSKLLFMEELP